MLFTVHDFIAINSLGNILDPIVVCFLLNHIGARFTNIVNPVCDRCVTLFAVCDVSTNAVACICQSLDVYI